LEIAGLVDATFEEVLEVDLVDLLVGGI